MLVNYVTTSLRNIIIDKELHSLESLLNDALCVASVRYSYYSKTNIFSIRARILADPVHRDVVFGK